MKWISFFKLPENSNSYSYKYIFISTCIYRDALAYNRAHIQVCVLLHLGKCTCTHSHGYRLHYYECSNTNNNHTSNNNRSFYFITVINTDNFLYWNISLLTTTPAIKVRHYDRHHGDHHQFTLPILTLHELPVFT